MGAGCYRSRAARQRRWERLVLESSIRCAMTFVSDSGSADALEPASAGVLYLAARASQQLWGRWRALLPARCRVCLRTRRLSSRRATLPLCPPPKGRPSTFAHRGTFFDRKTKQSRSSSEGVRELTLMWPMILRVNAPATSVLPSTFPSRDSSYGAQVPEPLSTSQCPQHG